MTDVLSGSIGIEVEQRRLRRLRQRRVERVRENRSKVWESVNRNRARCGLSGAVHSIAAGRVGTTQTELPGRSSGDRILTDVTQRVAAAPGHLRDLGRDVAGHQADGACAPLPAVKGRSWLRGLHVEVNVDMIPTGVVTRTILRRPMELPRRWTPILFRERSPALPCERAIAPI